MLTTKTSKSQKIYVSAKPLAEKADVESISPEQFAKEIGFEWLDTPHSMFEQGGILQNLVICKKNTVGYGVFASAEIPKGTIIGRYAAKKQSFASPEEFFQTYSAKDSSYCLDVEGKVYDAKEAGNMTRFINHAPTEQELESFVIDPTIREAVATDNLEPLLVEGEIILRTKQKILPNQELFLSYGINYWQKIGKPCFLFDKQGAILDSSLYMPLQVRMINSGQSLVGGFRCDANFIFAAGLDLNRGIDFGLFKLNSEKLVEQLHKQGVFFSVSKEFNKPILESVSSLYEKSIPSTKLQEENQAFLKTLEQALKQRGLVTVVELLPRNIPDLGPNNVLPLDLIISTADKADGDKLKTLLAEEGIFSVCHQDKYIIVPHINGSFIGKKITHLINKYLAEKPVPAGELRNAKLIKFSDYLQQQARFAVSANARQVYTDKAVSKIDTQSYDDAVTLFKAQQYLKAKRKLLQFIGEVSAVQSPQGFNALVKAYSTLASCHRELGEIDRAVELCETAFNIANERSLKPEEISKLLDKYLTCLQKGDYEFGFLYMRGNQLYQNGNYSHAKVVLELALKANKQTSSAAEQSDCEEKIKQCSSTNKLTLG